MLVKGDKIRLVKSMGAFTNVGEICEVHSVDADGNITFKFGGGMHKGYMSPDEFEKYFEKVEPVKEENNCMHFAKDDHVRMINANSFLAPIMSVGDEFTIVDMQYGVVVLESDDETSVTISENLLYENFEKIEEEVETNFFEGHDYIDDMINHSQINITKVFDKCTIVACKLPNGFVIVESSSCVDPADYNEKLGIDICLSRIKMRIAEMEAYASHEEMSYGCDCECGCDCDDCPYEEDDEKYNYCEESCMTCDCNCCCDECDHEGEYRRKKN